jgi:hypothetical protein
MPSPEEEKELIRNRYRFQGYQLPKIQLDETGATNYYVWPHPYFYNQPAFWQQEVYDGDPYGGNIGDLVGGEIPTTADTDPVINTSDERAIDDDPDSNSDSGSSQLYNLLPPTK